MVKPTNTHLGLNLKIFQTSPWNPIIFIIHKSFHYTKMYYYKGNFQLCSLLKSPLISKQPSLGRFISSLSNAVNLNRNA